MTKKSWFAWHSWIGVMTGLLMFVICWSGAFATIARELDWLANPDLRVTPIGDRAALIDAYEAVTYAYPQAEIINVSRGIGRRFADSILIRMDGDRLQYLYFDPYSRSLSAPSSRLTIQRFFRAFHMYLFNPAKIGLFFVSAFGLALLLSLLTSLMFYSRWWRRFLELKTGNGARAFWSSCHKVAGLWSIWFIMVIGATSVWYLFEHSRVRLVDGIAVYVGDEGYSATALPPARDSGLPMLPIETLFARAQELRPDIDIRSVSPNQNGYFYIDGQAGQVLVRDRANQLYIDKATGEVIYDQTASSLPLYWRWSDTADPLHFGDFGGFPTKLIWFVFGIALSGLALTGAWLHIKRLERDKAGRAHWRGTLAAATMTVAVIGASVWEGGRFIKGLGPVVSGVQHWPEASGGVVIVVLAWSLVTAGMLGFGAGLLVKRNAVARSRSASDSVTVIPTSD